MGNCFQKCTKKENLNDQSSILRGQNIEALQKTLEIIKDDQSKGKIQEYLIFNKIKRIFPGIQVQQNKMMEFFTLDLYCFNFREKDIDILFECKNYSNKIDKKQFIKFIQTLIIRFIVLDFICQKQLQVIEEKQKQFDNFLQIVTSQNNFFQNTEQLQKDLKYFLSYYSQEKLPFPSKNNIYFFFANQNINLPSIFSFLQITQNIYLVILNFQFNQSSLINAANKNKIIYWDFVKLNFGDFFEVDLTFYQQKIVYVLYKNDIEIQLKETLEFVLALERKETFLSFQKKSNLFLKNMKI